MIQKLFRSIFIPTINNSIDLKKKKEDLFYNFVFLMTSSNSWIEFENS